KPESSKDLDNKGMVQPILPKSRNVAMFGRHTLTPE
ncbi:hypothetical protein PSYMO_27439, partial [Pseudomonas amygdali pv. mori str. 301020]